MTTLSNRSILVGMFLSVLSSASFGVDVLVKPWDNKRKAVPLPLGQGSVVLRLCTEDPWRVRDSDILHRDDETLWMRESKTQYRLSNAYAPNEYVAIWGTLTKDGAGGQPPLFQLTVPKVNLSWEASCGMASRESEEHVRPAALLVTSNPTCHRHLVLKRPRDKGAYAGFPVKLSWDAQGGIKVWNGSSEVVNNSELTVTDELRLRVEPRAVLNNVVTFTARSRPDDYGGECAEDSVKAFTYDLVVDRIRFNHDVNSATSDGYNIRRSYADDSFDITNGEWTAARGMVAPVLYRREQSMTVKVKFRTSSPHLSSALIDAVSSNVTASTWNFGETSQQTATFTASPSGRRETDWMTFTFQGRAPRYVGVYGASALNWRVRDVNGGGDSQLVATKTGPHKVYAILGDPVEPWSLAFGSNQNPWINALEWACTKAQGAGSEDGAASAITFGINECGRFRYETDQGGACYAEMTDVDLTQCIARLNGHSGRGESVNCTDCASFLTSFSNLLGCHLYSSRMFHTLTDSFMTREYTAIGCPDLTAPSWGWGFSYHEVAWDGSCDDSDYVYDACLKYIDPAATNNLPQLPFSVRFSDGSPDYPYVYRERLTPPGPDGYDRCIARPDTKIRRRVK